MAYFRKFKFKFFLKLAIIDSEFFTRLIALKTVTCPVFNLKVISVK